MTHKRGISPIIATMLLISIALLLAVIIFLWARAFLNEQIQKDLGGGPEPIESFCKDVNFDAEAFTQGITESYLRVVNRGNIPIHGMEVRQKGVSSVTSVGTFSRNVVAGSSNPARTISIGEDASITLYSSSEPIPGSLLEPFADGTKLLVSPIILGEKGTQYEAHACDNEFAHEVSVKKLV